jgi:1-acyl-sn-glycerol-3-phosphate acyltransferase
VPDTARTPEQLEKRLVVRAGKAFTRLFTSRFHDLKVLTPCPIPPAGPAILVSNHTSSLDPALLQAAVPRLITWMMAKEYFMFGTRWFFNAIEPILVERSGKDMAATRAGLRALHAGKVLGVFPEGRIETGPELLEFQTGVALLALRSGAPVFPAYLDGMQRGKGMLEAIVSPGRSTIVFGPQVQLDGTAEGREGLEAATAKIRDSVAALMPLSRG